MGGVETKEESTDLEKPLVPPETPRTISRREAAEAAIQRQNNIVFFGICLVGGLGACYKFYRDWIHKAFMQDSVFHALDVERLCNDVVDLCIVLLTILMLGTLIYDPFSDSGVPKSAADHWRKATLVKHLSKDYKKVAGANANLKPITCPPTCCSGLVSSMGARINQLWKNTHFFPGLSDGFMAGGFVPRPAALAMAGLLFATKTFITEEMVLGRDLSSTTLHMYDGCIASHSVSRQNQGRFAVSRFFREKPLGCYGVNKTYSGYTRTEIYAGHVKENASFEQTVDVAGGDKICVYQCAKWKAVSVETLVSNMGIIFTGANMVVKFTVMISGYCGFTRVDQDTEPKQMMRLFDMLQYCEAKTKGKWFYRSAILCAIQVAFLAFIPYVVAPFFAVDGYYTVDYYLNRSVWTSTLFVLLFRLWNPYYMRPLVCTMRMWQTGKDTFYIADSESKTATAKEYDLHQWLHLPTKIKMKLLVRYAQRLTVRDIRDFRASPTTGTVRVTNPEEIHGENKTADVIIKKGMTGTLKAQGTSEEKVTIEWDEASVGGNIRENFSLDCVVAALLESDENDDKSMSRIEVEANKKTQRWWSTLARALKAMIITTPDEQITWQMVKEKHIDIEENVVEEPTLKDCLVPCCFCTPAMKKPKQGAQNNEKLELAPQGQ